MGERERERKAYGDKEGLCSQRSLSLSPLSISLSISLSVCLSVLLSLHVELSRNQREAVLPSDPFRQCRRFQESEEVSSSRKGCPSLCLFLSPSSSSSSSSTSPLQKEQDGKVVFSGETTLCPHLTVSNLLLIYRRRSFLFFSTILFPFLF